MSTTTPLLTAATVSAGPTPRKKVTTTAFRQKKERGEPITMLTAYDYPTALAEDQAGIDSILVGDSLGMVVQGHDSTLPVTLDQMVYHCAAVRRGRRRSLYLPIFWVISVWAGAGFATAVKVFMFSIGCDRPANRARGSPRTTPARPQQPPPSPPRPILASKCVPAAGRPV